LASPHFAALHGLPRTLIHVGEHEALLGDAQALTRPLLRAQAHGAVVSLDDAQRLGLQVAQALVDEVNARGTYANPVVTEVQMLANYARAEEYHQNFFAKNPTQGYCMAVAAPKVEKFRKTFARLARG
jgi:hypothetical protein